MEPDGIGSSIRIVIQIVLYVMVVLCGLVTSISVGITSSEFGGKCIMYATAKDNGEKKVLVYFGPKSNCNFVIGTHVFGLLYAGAMAALHIYALVMKSRKQKLEFIHSFIFTVTTLGVHVLKFFLCFAAACLTTVGLNKFCGSLEDRFEKYRIDDCSFFQTSLNWIDLDGSSFHTNYTIAIIVGWVATVLWLALAVLSALTLWRDIKTGRSLGRSPPGPTATTDTTNNTRDPATPVGIPSESYNYEQ